MYKLKARIEGVAPLLLNAVTVAQLEAPASSRKTKEDRINEGWARVHRNDAGEAIVPRWTLKRCFLDGVKLGRIKDGRASAVGLLQPIVFFQDAVFGKDPDELDEQWGRVPPRTGPAVVVRRPKYRTGWALDLSIDVLEETVRPDLVHLGLEQAGLRAGLGAWRPEYGRFIVTEFEKV